MLLDHEIAEERSVEHLDRKVLTPGGYYARVTHVCKTIPLPVWRLKTSTHTLECAASHLVVTDRGAVPVDQILSGDLIMTDNGWEAVTTVEDLQEERELYDLRVDSPSHLYFTGGIASHNSTGLGAAELFKFSIFPNYGALYITPLKEQNKTIADKMMDMQRGSIYPPEYFTRRQRRCNMYYKESPRGGSLKLLHVLTDPSKIRGNSVPSVVIDEAQDFDPEHLPEINQVQKNFRTTRTTIFAGTSKDLDTCLEQQYRMGSGGVWHIPCGCKEKWHSMDPPDSEIIKGYMSVDGLVCPHTKGRRLNPMSGEFVHARPSRLNLNMPSFHLPQVVVPEYAQGAGFVDIWKDFIGYPFKKFLMEVWGIAVESGMTEISERDLQACCTDYTFAQTQERLLNGKQRYSKVISGVDWGGSDWEPSYRSKLSYTVHTIWGLKGDGKMDLIYARRYEGMDYKEIAGTIVEQHLKYGGFAIGSDNGGGSYYNAYLRDCGRIPLERIVHFQYTDTKLMLARIPSDIGINLMSLHRSDSISALLADVKEKNLNWPRWDESAGFALDFLNTRRNITEAPSGRTVMRYIKHGAKADDFMQSANYACMMKRVINRESIIPNQQIMEELGRMFGMSIPRGSIADIMDGGYVSG